MKPIPNNFEEQEDEISDDAKNGEDENEEIELEPIRQSDGSFVTQYISKTEDESHQVECAKKKTTPFLTKYERAALLGCRAEELSQGAPAFIAVGGETDPMEIAIKELKLKKMPIIIRRKFPDGTFEDRDVNELIVLD